MTEDQELFQSLVALRQHIKDTAESERTPAVCSDEVLHEMARLVPVKLSDLESIPGIGKVFIDNYGEQFLRVINRHERNVQGGGFLKVSINKSVLETLKELEKKLVNINKRNHLLYMPRIQSKYAVDLFNSESDPRDIILGPGKKVEICNSKDESSMKKVVSLLRANSRMLREKGQNNLFIAYPFVKGKLAGDNGFEIRAPLALFPVNEERTPSSIKLSLDRSRDILYNTTLILAYYKTANINKALPPEALEDNTRDTFFDNISVFFKNCDLEVTIPETENELHAFKDYTADSFPKFKPGEMILDNSIVLGNFPICSSSIQKDFQQIAESGIINTLLNDLLSDGTNDETESKKDIPVQENNIYYINDLNSSQEKVLNQINTSDELVMEGPPGTGKSQTITSLISQAALSGKTVLMVSEKKTALDVVYSRLGELSKYALIIDDVNNKNLFYQQMADIIHMQAGKNTVQKSSATISVDIENQLDSLEKVSRELYTPDSFGIEPYKLYLKCPKIDFNETQNFQRQQFFTQNAPQDILSCTYPVLSKCAETFSDEDIVEQTDTYTSLNRAYPLLSKMKNNLTDFDIQQIMLQWQSLKGQIDEYNKKNAIARLFTGGRTKKAVREFASNYFDAQIPQNAKEIIQKPEEFIAGVENYSKYYELKPLYDSHSPEEKSYFSFMQAVQRQCDNSLVNAGKEVLQFLLYKHLMEFETSHRDAMLTINNFPNIIRNVSQDIQNKTKITRDNLKNTLYQSLGMLTESKRKNDILRAIESKRKMSVNKFISKFDFELFKGIKIWLLTPEVVSEIIPLQIGVFDLLVFDEASQMYVEKGLPSILRAKKVIVAGDQKQLRPSSLGTGRITFDEDDLDEDEEISAALEEESLLDLAKYRYDNTLLNFHYRSQFEELIAFSNYAFYNAQLYVSPNTYEKEERPIQVHRIENAIWDKRRNMEEATFIIGLLKDIFANRKENETIGIITFNTSQRDLIEDLIDKECSQDFDFAEKVHTEMQRTKDGEDIGLFVKNIENVQGDERDIIIFSIGYAKNREGKFIQNFGWLNQAGGENRLNVAISRAKKQVHVVCSFDPSELNVENTKNPGPAILKKYLEYTSAVSQNKKEEAKRILLSLSSDSGDNAVSDDESQTQKEYFDSIADALSQEGIEFQRNVGIGGYSIDFALKKEGRFVLGLECDSHLYTRPDTSRNRDYHRQKYLESRGWKIFRLWASSWWKNRDQELQKISDLYDSL